MKKYLKITILTILFIIVSLLCSIKVNAESYELNLGNDVEITENEFNQSFSKTYLYEEDYISNGYIAKKKCFPIKLVPMVVVKEMRL